MNLSVKSINRYKQKTMELLREELKEYLKEHDIHLYTYDEIGH